MEIEQTYRAKSARVFGKIFGTLAGMGIEDHVIESMKPYIRRNLDRQFKSDDYDYEDASRRFLASLSTALSAHDFRSDKIEYLCCHVIESLEFDFAQDRGNR